MIDLFRVDIINGRIKWEKDNMINKSYTCGYCGAYVSSDKGMPLLEQGHTSSTKNMGVYICTNCYMPTFIYYDIQIPGARFGASVKIFRFQALDLGHL